MRNTLPIFIAAAAIAVAACGGSGSNPTAPSNAGSNAEASSASPARPAPSGAETEIRGLVDAVPPATPALTFTVAGRTVVTSESTLFVEDGNRRAFSDLRVGDSVEVRGTASGDTIAAARVEFEDRVGAPGPIPGPQPGPNPGPGPGPGPNPGPNPGPRTEVEIRGPIAGLTGSATRFEFTLNGVTITGDASTDLENDDDDDAVDRDTPASFADLANGVEVHVKGTPVSNGSILAREIEIEDDDEGDDDDDEARVRGSLGPVTGTCPSIASTAAGVKFTTSASTRFDNACSSFRSGDSVEVRGRRNSDGSIAATRLRKR